MRSYSLETIIVALTFIDAHDRDVWLNIGNALKTEFGEIAFSVFDSWSQTADNYDAKAVKSVWSGYTLGKVRIGTVIYHAELGGFDRSKHESKPIDPQEQAARQAKREQQEQEAIANEQAEHAAYMELLPQIDRCVNRAISTPYAESKDIAENLFSINSNDLHRFKNPMDPTKTIGYYLNGLITLAPFKRLDTKQLVAFQAINGAPDSEGKNKGRFAKQFIGKVFFGGGYYWIGDIDTQGVKVIVEGMSDANTLFEKVGYCSLAAGKDTQLMQAALDLRQHCQNDFIIIFGDNDKNGKGQRLAQAASKAIKNSIFLLPPKQYKDVNEWYLAEGSEGIKKMIDAAIDSKKAAPSSEEDAAPKTQPTKQIVAGSSKHGEGEIETHRNMPKGTPDMLYGLFGEVGLAAAKDTEVNPYAAAMNHMTYFSGCIGRGVYFYIGNTKHHINLFTLHIGRSSHGKKGDAHSLTNRIVDAISQQTLTNFGDAGLLPQRHTGGLSTREGLAALIHDGYTQGKDEIAPITDKRIFIKESEFANVIQQSGRTGNTLSTAIRDGWDGLSIQPATKHKGMWASNPHIAISGACTPTELLQLTTQNDIGNGFLNRFIIFWAERNKLVPFPQSTPNEVVQHLAIKTRTIIQFAKGNYAWNENPSLANEDNRQITLSDDAKKLYGGLYLKELNKSTDGAKVAALMGRNAPYLLRLAALFALSDLSLVIDEQHIKAAYAWVQYWHESVKFIFNDAVEEVRNTETSSNADKIMDYLKGRKEHCATKTQISSDVFHRNLSSKNLDVAIHQLLTSTPPKLEVRDGERSDGGTGKKSKLYYLYEFNELYEVTTAARDTVNSYSYEVSPKSTNLGNQQQNEQKPNFVNSLNSSELRAEESLTAATNFVKFVQFVEANTENEVIHDDEFEEGVI